MDRSSFYFILDNQCRFKDAHKIFKRKHSPSKTDNFKKGLLFYVLLQKLYTLHLNILCLSYPDM